MLSWLKNFFVPNEQNNYKPRILRKETILLILGVVFLFEAVFLLQILVVFQKTNLLATVLPSVVADLTNEKRLASNLQPLESDQLLESVAQLKAQDMAQKGYFSHTSPDGKTPWYWFEKAGYRYEMAGENLAIHFFDSQDLVATWMDSSSHRANILNRNFTETGIGVANGLYEEKETVYIVQLFGRPAKISESTAELPVLEKEPKPSETKDITEIKEKIPAEKEEEEVSPLDMFIAKKDESGSPAPEIFGAEKLEETKDTGILLQSSLPERIISSPRAAVGFFYILLLIIISIALILNIFVHFKVQYVALIMSAFFVIIVIILTLFANQYIIFSQGKIF